MKRTIAVPVVVIALSVLGCQGNNAVDPLSGSAPGVLGKTQPAGLPIGLTEVLPLEGTLREPGLAFNSFVATQGKIEVTTILSNEGPLRTFTVTTHAFAELYPLDDSRSSRKGWFIAGSAKEVVAVKSFATFVRTYTVEGRDDATELHISLRMNRNGAVQVVGMKLTNKLAPVVHADGK
jgi:hypothetical protein